MTSSFINHQVTYYSVIDVENNVSLECSIKNLSDISGSVAEVRSGGKQ